MPKDAGGAARSVAFDLLRLVLKRRRTLDDALAVHNGFRLLAARDRAFARLIVATALRRLGQIDALIDACLDRPLPAAASGARDILRLAVAEMLFLGVAPHASVNSAVNQVRMRQLAAFGGLANAVLRRLAREGAAMLAAIPPNRNVPAWLLDRWTETYGREASDGIAEALAREPPLDLSVKSDAGAWAGRLGATALATGSLRCSFGGPISEMPGFAEGAWWVQDAAAALPARLLGDVRKKRVLDLCAAPGGKTAQLLAAGARVTAVDRSEARIARLRRNLSRLRMRAHTAVADATVWRPNSAFDAVLLDPPCTATGTIRRRPDILHLKSFADLSKLTALQDRLLRNSIDMVAVGGRIVFCTCSLEPEEGEQRIEALLASGAPVQRDPVGAGEIGGLAEAVTASGDLRTMPTHLGDSGGLDGFYAARLIRTG